MRLLFSISFFLFENQKKKKKERKTETKNASIFKGGYFWRVLFCFFPIFIDIDADELSSCFFKACRIYMYANSYFMRRDEACKT